MRTLTTALLLFAAVSASASCGRATRSDNGSGASGRASSATWSVIVQPLQSPSGPNSSEPQLTASERGPVLSWIERAGTMTHLKFSERSSSGWSAAMTAASGSDWFLSYADVPSVMRKRDGTLVAQWLRTTDPRTEGYDLLLSYSRDEGKTWARPFTPHHDGTRFQHGFASFVELPGDALGLVWLDGRNSEFLDNDPTSGTMTLRYAAYDSGWKQTAEAEIDHNACECCSTAVVATTDGMLVAFRDRVVTGDKEIRDIAVARIENGKWTEPRAVYNDNWEMYACPVNGPALSARGTQVAVAWFTVKNETGQAYAAFSNDAGRTWGTPIRLDDAASLGRVDIDLLDDGSAVATWVEYADRRGQFRLRRVDPSGTKSPAITVAGVQGSSTSGFPRFARHGNELVFAWTESAQGGGEGDTTLTVKTAVAQLPQ
jgi:hypothetical protein